MLARLLAAKRNGPSVPPAGAVSLSRRTLYLIRHPHLALWWRDPYRLRPGALDRRYEWTTRRERAWRFPTHAAAEASLRDTGEAGIIEADRR